MLNSLFTEINSETSANVIGGSNIVNFDASSYAFGIGAGATFNGGVTANVVDSAFQSSVSSRQPMLIGYSFGPYTLLLANRNGNTITNKDSNGNISTFAIDTLQLFGTPIFG